MIKRMLNRRRYRKRVKILQSMDGPQITRDFILDSRLMEGQAMSTLLGLPEITEEAIAASEERSKRVSHLFPLIAFFASSLSTGVMSYYDTVNPTRGELTPDEQIAMEAWVAKVAISCTLGSLAQLESLDLIKVTR